jgi:two-component system sensor histidine kinase KdpD
VCWLNQGLRSQRAAAHESEERTQALCQLSLDLSRVVGESELAERAERHLRELFGHATRLVLNPATPASVAGLEPVPIHDGARVIGYIQCELEQDFRGERKLLLDASADRIADAYKLLQLGEAARRAEIDAEIERNRSALLSAVSHDMKTPLASIMAAGSVLLGQSGEQRLADTALLETIVQESERMSGMITNLLDVTRLESGKARLRREAEAIDELVHAALERFLGRFGQRKLTLDLPDTLPMVCVDAVLIDHLLGNLLENVARYTPLDSPLEISASAQGGWVELKLIDHGPGIPATERPCVFEKFFRGQAARHKDGGTGLGLTICKAVVAAHGGTLELADSEPSGTTVMLTLPVSRQLAAEAAMEWSTHA